MPRYGAETCISPKARTEMENILKKANGILLAFPECVAIEGEARRFPSGKPFGRVGAKRGRGVTQGQAFFQQAPYKSPRELALWGMPFGQMAYKDNSYGVFENAKFPDADDPEWVHKQGVGIPSPDLLGQPYPEIYPVTGGGGGAGFHEGPFGGPKKRGEVGDVFVVHDGVPNPLWPKDKPLPAKTHFVTIDDLPKIGKPKTPKAIEIKPRKRA